MDVNINELMKFGFLNVDLDKNLDLISEIEKLKIKKNAIILAHYYQTGDIQDIADFVGDSLALAQRAEATNAPVIVMSGVNFMAETVKLLCPKSKVLLPDLNAGCSLADSCNEKEFKIFKKKYSDHIVVSYINTTIQIKALTDIACTSANAIDIINSIPENKNIIFAPDRNLGNYLKAVTGRELKIWNGACHVHEEFSIERILKIKSEENDIKLISHPECKKALLLISDYIGSTASLLKFVNIDKSKRYIVATESGIIHQMKKLRPDKIFIPAPPNDSSCGCIDCNFMKLNTMKKLYICLKYELPEIKIERSLMKRAVRPIKKMLEISSKIRK